MSTDASMTRTQPRRQLVVATLVRILVAFDSLALLFAAALHIQGAQIPVGSVEFSEPQIVPAAIVEGLAGILFVVATYAVFAGRRWAWGMTLFAHIFAILGFLVGIFSTRNGTSPFNHVYHFVMLGVFLIGVALLLTPPARAALHSDGQRPGEG